MSNHDTILSRLSSNCAKYPRKTASTFLLPGPNGGKVQRAVTYTQLSEETTRLAKVLLEAGIPEGGR